MDREQEDPFFSELLRVVESEIHRSNCILSHIWYKSFFSNDKKCHSINLHQTIEEMLAEADGKSDGLVVIGKCNKEALKKLNQKYKGVVSVNRNSTNYEVDEVLCDGKKIAETAVEHLIALGHRSIGYLGGCSNEMRYMGYTDTLCRHGIEINPNYIYESRLTEADGYDVMQKLLKAESRPTGIYCGNDIAAIGMLKCINKYHNRLYAPSIISSDDIEEAQHSKPMLTTVRLPKEEMGRFAISLLADRLKKGHTSVVRLELESRLVIRDSCKDVQDSDWIDYYI